MSISNDKPKPALEMIRLANFKALGEPLQSIPLRPITLVFGKNSAGKSSIIHSLLWLHHMVHRDTVDVVTPLLGKGTVDLGGFRQFRFGHKEKERIVCEFDLPNFTGPQDTPDSARLLSLRVEYGTLNQVDPLAELKAMLEGKKPLPAKCQELIDHDKIAQLAGEHPDLFLSLVETLFFSTHYYDFLKPYYDQTEVPEHTEALMNALRNDTFPPDESDYNGWIGQAYEEFCPYYCELMKRANERLALIGEETHDKQQALSKADVSKLMQASLRLSIAMWETLSPRLKQPKPGTPRALRMLVRNGDEVLFEADENADGTMEVRYWHSFPKPELGASTPEASVTPKVVLKNTGWLPREVSSSPEAGDEHATLISSFLSEVKCKAKEALGTIDYLGPLRTHPVRHLRLADLDIDKEDHSKWAQLITNPSARESVNCWLEKLGSSLELRVQELVSLERAAEIFKQQMLREIDNFDLAVERDLIEDRSGDNEIQIKLDAYYNRIREPSVSSAINQSLEVLQGSKSLHGFDRRTNAEVSFRDIGLGTSQMIPVLVSALTNRDTLIAIEQPEIHLHPALQAELGDLFIESALGENGNQFILETHSEHLILRLLRRVRETQRNKLPEGKRGLRSEDVSILYVAPEEQGSRVLVMNVNEHGKLTNNWPEGFFEERLAELF